MLDSRGNLFNENGLLQSQKVIDDWWVFPDYSKFTEKFPVCIGLGYDMLVWKIKQFIPLSN